MNYKFNKYGVLEIQNNNKKVGEVRQQPNSFFKPFAKETKFYNLNDIKKYKKY